MVWYKLFVSMESRSIEQQDLVGSTKLDYIYIHDYNIIYSCSRLVDSNSLLPDVHDDVDYTYFVSTGLDWKKQSKQDHQDTTDCSTFHLVHH
jgi:hypothetical protein